MPLPTAPPVGTRVRTLRGLSRYACGHTGSCCRAGWPIPVETAPLGLLRAAASHGTLPVVDTPAWIHDGVLGQTPANACVFHAPVAGQAGCSLETTLGSDALPYSCRQFPRLLLVDARGWHLSLSAWCGTVARLIIPQPTAENTSPADRFLSFDHIEADSRVHLEALDARDAWPPLLRPGVLAGHDAYATWEAGVVADFLGPACAGTAAPAAMLASALCWTDRLRSWRQADGSLEVLARRPWRHPDAARLLRHAATPDVLRSRVLTPLLAGIPPEWRPEAWPLGLTDASIGGVPVGRRQADAALGRYLATRLVGSWVAYQGSGLRSVATSLVHAYVLAALALEATAQPGTPPVTLGRLTSAIRAADWLLLHLPDRDVWARICSAHESEADAGPLLFLIAGASRVLDALDWD
jgi:hypothetical protein